MSRNKFLLLLSLLVLLIGTICLLPAQAAGPYQAEDANVGGGCSVESNHTGYNGTGFVNFPSNGGYVEYQNVDGEGGGTATLQFRFALGATSSRTGRLTVNGSNQNITFDPTGAWNSWAVKEVVVTLNSGTNNTIRLESTGQDLANQDQLVTVSSGPNPTTPPEPTVPPSGVIPQTNWTLVYVDSEELQGEDGAATNAFDGNSSTIWHTEWYNTNPSHPHEIQIDLGATYSVTGFRYLPRQTSTLNGTIAQYEFYVSTSTSSWGSAVASGTFAGNNSEKEVTFVAKTGRYVRLRALSEINGNPWTSAAEINVLAGEGPQPTSVPPTSVPPTSVPPTSVPPTSVPPTSVPPTSVPPTSVPPTSVPPTAVPPTVPPSGPYQAEDANIGGGCSVESNHTGYNGTGFVNFPSNGGYVEYQNVDGEGGGSATLQFRFALGATSSRTGRLTVNGSNQNITFDPTGAWNSWAIKEVVVTLNSGTNNTIRLESTGQDLANQDQLEVIPGGVPPTSVPPTSIPPTSIPPTSIPPTSVPPTGHRQMEELDRGVVRVAESNGNFISWRLFGTDPANIGFNVYRGSTKLNSSPITNSTNYFDSGGSSSSTYTVRPVINGVEQAASGPSLNLSSNNYLSIPLQRPPGGTVGGSSYTYEANDASVGDLDGDGQYEIVLKWYPSNAKDNSQAGYTGNTILDAYELDGTRLWRIDLGRNIRSGAHYTQFLVYDFDGDGRAEVTCKTADGTVDGQGNVIGNASADYRNSDGYVLDGPEYLTVFDGRTGAALDTESYIPARGNVCDWGDCYGNRVDRFLATVAYVDGARPSLVMCRGYYTRSVLVAWNFRNGQLTRVWTFDSNSSGNGSYAGQGNHNLSAGDVDGDGKDEIIYGSMAVDDDGTRLWNTGLGHGDAMHFSDLDPSRAGLEVWGIHEGSDTPGSAFLNARTGQIYWQTGNSDAGRGVAADITASYAGAECWGGTSGLRRCTNNTSAGSTPASQNHLIWWDGDLLRELLDGTSITKYGGGTLLSASGCASNNGTKSNPTLTVDLFGDWREEAIWRTSDNNYLRIYTTSTVTNYRIYTLMHDPIYRLGISWQNVAYNQPPHTGFFLGDGMSTPPTPDIYYP